MTKRQRGKPPLPKSELRGNPKLVRLNDERLKMLQVVAKAKNIKPATLMNVYISDGLDKDAIDINEQNAL